MVGSRAYTSLPGVKILWINPLGTSAYDSPMADLIRQIKEPRTTVELVSLKMNATLDNLEYRTLEALVVRETLYGKVHGDLLGTVDGLAYALFGQKKYDEAEPVYQRLLVLWVSSMGTETNAMVAIAHDKMAVFYAAQKKWEEARAHETLANAIRAYLLAEGLQEEASQRIEEGTMTEAVPLYKRAEKILDPPNEIYDEQRATIQNMQKELEKALNKPPSKTPPPTRK